MADDKTPNKQKAAANSNTSVPQERPAGAKNTPRAPGKGGDKPRVGGPAVQGAKSTLPKEMPTSSDPNEQQMASYNRTMRRRMEQMGTTTTQQRMDDAQKRRNKRIERRKQRLEERREDIRKSLPAGRISLGRRNTYFIIAAAILVVLIIVVFAVLHSMHMIGG